MCLHGDADGLVELAVAGALARIIPATQTAAISSMRQMRRWFMILFFFLPTAKGWVEPLGRRRLHQENPARSTRVRFRRAPAQALRMLILARRGLGCVSTFAMNAISSRRQVTCATCPDVTCSTRPTTRRGS